MEKTFRVLEIVSSMSVDNGVASFAMNYLRRMSHSKFIVDFAVCNDNITPYNDEIEAYDGKVFSLPRATSIVNHINECEKIISRNRYDIVHDNALTQSVFLMREAKKKSVPVRILHSHSARLGTNPLKILRGKSILHFLKNYSTDFAACSKKAGETYFSGREFTLIPNVVDEQCLVYKPRDRNTIREELNVEDKLVIATVGRLAAEKNPRFALKVFKEFKKKNDKAIYWWIGSGPLEEEVKEYACELGIQDSTVFMGKRTDMQNLYQAIDIFFLPSIFEGMPLTGIEAQTMGLPCVVSDSITKEIDFTKLIQFVSLNDPIETWTNVLGEQVKRVNERRAYTEELKRSPFSALNAGERLESYYQNLLDKANR